MNRSDEKILRVRKVIEDFNANPNRPFDDFYGRKVYHYARQPILATDCDYEIVTVSGVNGRKLEE